MNDNEIAQIVSAEELSALDYNGEISKKRARALDYYNTQPYGDEIEGQSSAVTSDVSDVIEWMLPSLIRLFTQGRVIAKFEGLNAASDKEADDKTNLTNYLFTKENNAVLTLHNMFKDALLQYTGVVKVSWENYETSTRSRYEGMSSVELQALESTDGVTVSDIEFEEKNGEKIYDAEIVTIKSSGRIRYDNIPPEEFLVSKTARDFVSPRFIGHRSPKTRSELIEMGFDRVIVNKLPKHDDHSASEEKAARYHDINGIVENNPTNHSPNDIIYLGEYYLEMDVDDDGITEYWKVFYAGDTVLEKEQVEDHPFAVCVPIPIPHRAIGTCPAEQVADIQFRKSTLTRHMLDNVYQSNYPRILRSNKVDLDDLLTPRAAGVIDVDTDSGDVAGHAYPFTVPNMIDGVMRAIEYTDQEREIRTGITRYSQGLDGEALNKTATGFKGIMDASQQRLDLVARLFAEGGVKQIFEKTVKILSLYQDEEMQIRANGEELKINPKKWGDNTLCRIDVGLGSGDRQEKIINLNNILAIQERQMAAGLQLTDQVKMYNTLDKLIDEVGLKSAEDYFNNPEVPENLLMAKLEALFKENILLKQQQNPLAEAELIKAKARMAEVEGKELNSMRQFIMEMAQKDRHFAAELARDLTKLELDSGKNIPGAIT